MAVSRRTYRSRSGRPRNGRLVSSREGGCSTLGRSGRRSATHESHRRHRYQRGKRAIRTERRRRDLAQRPVKALGLVRAGAGRGDHQEDPGTAEDHAAPHCRPA
ncbi:MAG: hypothetical protein WA895_13515 [Streptosporangiaceae bacterium]